MATTPASPAPAQPDVAPSASAPSAARAHASLLPFALTLLGANIVLHLLIVLAGNRITLLTTLPLLAIAVGFAVYLLTRGRSLGRVRYGRFVAHALGYAIINVGYLLHAYVLVATGSPAIAGTGTPLDPAWLGATFAMAGIWGLGLILHGIGAVLDRGFETARA